MLRERRHNPQTSSHVEPHSHTVWKVRSLISIVQHTQVPRTLMVVNRLLSRVHQKLLAVGHTARADPSSPRYTPKTFLSAPSCLSSLRLSQGSLDLGQQLDPSRRFAGRISAIDFVDPEQVGDDHSALNA